MKLTLILRAEYWQAIRSGSKLEEYRLVCPYWDRRLEGRCYDGLVLLCGYAPRGDASRRLELPWRGCTVRELTHPHFGPNPVRVWAIRLSA